MLNYANKRHVILDSDKQSNQLIVDMELNKEIDNKIGCLVIENNTSLR